MKKGVVVFLHIAYWLVFFHLLLLFFGMLAPQMPEYRETNGQNFALYKWYRMMVGFTIVPGIICFYSFYTLLFERFLHRRKIAKFIVYALLITFISSCIGLFILAILHNQMMLSTWQLSEISIMGAVIAVGALLNGMAGLVMKGFISWYGDIRVKEELNQQNLSMQSELVKAQMNPHFLFNTINNIDVLIHKNPDQASDYLNKLSDILRFLLYETKTEQVALKDELNCVEKYIALQKIRTANPNFVNFTISGNPSGISIAPMILLPFIENAFKHSENKKIENAITIHLRIESRKIIFDCTNHYNKLLTTNVSSHSGLGNELIRKRLELIYPNTHELTVSKNETTYHVQLVIAYT
ncbi:MAG: sensor histidine kinase [Bacteroidia bacterium]